MFQYLVIVVLAGFVGILLFDFFTKKKTEVDGAHVMVSLCFSFSTIWRAQAQMKSRFSFQVTGGSSGIGKALAIKLAQCGANVTVLARNMVRISKLF